MELQNLIDSAKAIQGTKQWDSASLLRVGISVSEQINTIKNLVGKDKMAIVILVITKVLELARDKEIADTPLDASLINDRYKSLETTVTSILPTSIEIAISAANGKLNLKKVSPSYWLDLVSCCLKSTMSILASENLISEVKSKEIVNVVEKVENKMELIIEKLENKVENKVENVIDKDLVVSIVTST